MRGVSARGWRVAAEDRQRTRLGFSYEHLFGSRVGGGRRSVTRPMRVLGIDPGLTRCGLGVVEGSVGRRLELIEVGVATTPADRAIELRLVALEAEIEAWLDRHRPDVVALERVFSQHNVRTVMGTAQVSGVAMAAAARRGLPVALHTPSEVKAAVTGSGRADKAQVGAMVTRLLGLDAVPKPADAADALALAICHVWRGSTTNRLQAAVLARAVAGRR